MQQLRAVLGSAREETHSNLMNVVFSGAGSILRADDDPVIIPHW